MVRAAARTLYVSIITDKKDYSLLISELNKNKGSTSLRLEKNDGSFWVDRLL